MAEVVVEVADSPSPGMIECQPADSISAGRIRPALVAAFSLHVQPCSAKLDIGWRRPVRDLEVADTLSAFAIALIRSLRWVQAVVEPGRRATPGILCCSD